MCRFLLIKSDKEKDFNSVLTEFALACKKSRTEEGDRQEDGWGAAWLDKNNNWKVYKSLKPIWKDKKSFNKIPSTKTLVVHARSASFKNQKGKLEFNQPFINEKYCFVFNGMIRGVNGNLKAGGEIGSQKIWNLIQKELGSKAPKKALKITNEMIDKNSKEIKGMNIGLASAEHIVALSNNPRNSKYFKLFNSKKDGTEIVCSEPLTSI